MDEFADVARARAAYKTFVDALSAGRSIIERAGVSNSPAIPDFDTVFRKLTPEMRRELYAELEKSDAAGAADAIRIWQPMIRRAFGRPRGTQ